jgi:hypothetical protein
VPTVLPMRLLLMSITSFVPERLVDHLDEDYNVLNTPAV